MSDPPRPSRGDEARRASAQRNTMPQVIRCPNPGCQQSMQVPDNAVGRNVMCPKCKKPFTVPGPVPVGAGVAAGPATGRAASVPTMGAAAAPPTSKPSVNLGTTPTASGTPKVCPSCGSPLLEGAIACMDCGFLLQGDGQTAEQEGPPNLCTNPACGVANPPGVRNCQRCDTPLPMAGGTLLHSRYRLDKLL